MSVFLWISTNGIASPHLSCIITMNQSINQLFFAVISVSNAVSPGISTGLLSNSRRQCNIRGLHCFASHLQSPSPHTCSVDRCKKAPHRGSDVCTWRLTDHSNLVSLFWPLTRLILAPPCCALILQNASAQHSVEGQCNQTEQGRMGIWA